jgi:hypothetical protein
MNLLLAGAPGVTLAPPQQFKLDARSESIETRKKMVQLSISWKYEYMKI